MCDGKHIRSATREAGYSETRYIEGVNQLAYVFREAKQGPVTVARGPADTGSFRHATITDRTFEICRRIAATGADPAMIAAEVYNNGSIGRLRVTGMLLGQMRLKHDNQIAVLTLTDGMLAEAGCAADDLEGIVNLPLAARDVQAVVFLKESEGALRVSLRSKDAVDIRQVAVSYGGGGHRNASGFTVDHPTTATRQDVIDRVAGVISRL